MDGISSVFPILDHAEIEVLGTWLDVDPATEARLHAILDNEARQRAARFRTPLLRRNHIAAHATLRLLLAARLGCDATSVVLTSGRHGKPMLALPQAASGLRFNLSHSGELAVYAFARHCDVGVDIEQVRSVPQHDGLARRYFTDTEARAIAALPADQRQLAFLACWTRKEAFIKALGEGMAHPLDAFEVSVDPATPARLLRIGPEAHHDAKTQDDALDTNGWSLEAFTPAPGYLGAVCWRKEQAIP